MGAMIIDRWVENRQTAVVCAGLALLISLLMLMDPITTQWLRFDRAAIAQGEVWRLVTGHFTHASWPHTGLNLAGLALIAMLFPEPIGYAWWLCRIVVVSLLTGVLMYGLLPELGWYVGLSGVLHGFFLLGFWWLYRDGDRFSLVLLALLVGKLTWEHFYGPITSSDELVGVPVLVEAHSYGALAAALYLAIAVSFKFVKKQIVHGTG